MTDETIKVTEETKNRLEDIKENYYEHTTLTYSEAVDVLVAEYDSGGGAGGDDTSSEEDGDFLGDEGGNSGLSAEEKAERFRQ